MAIQKTTLDMDKGLWKEARKLCIDREISFKEYVESLIRKDLGKAPALRSPPPQGKGAEHSEPEKVKTLKGKKVLVVEKPKRTFPKEKTAEELGVGIFAMQNKKKPR